MNLRDKIDYGVKFTTKATTGAVSGMYQGLKGGILSDITPQTLVGGMLAALNPALAVLTDTATSTGTGLKNIASNIGNLKYSIERGTKINEKQLDTLGEISRLHNITNKKLDLLNQNTNKNLIGVKKGIDKTASNFDKAASKVLKLIPNILLTGLGGTLLTKIFKPAQIKSSLLSPFRQSLGVDFNKSVLDQISILIGILLSKSQNAFNKTAQSYKSKYKEKREKGESVPYSAASAMAHGTWQGIKSIHKEGVAGIIGSPLATLLHLVDPQLASTIEHYTFHEWTQSNVPKALFKNWLERKHPEISRAYTISDAAHKYGSEVVKNQLKESPTETMTMLLSEKAQQNLNKKLFELKLQEKLGTISSQQLKKLSDEATKTIFDLDLTLAQKLKIKLGKDADNIRFNSWIKRQTFGDKGTIRYLVQDLFLLSHPEEAIMLSLASKSYGKAAKFALVKMFPFLRPVFGLFDTVAIAVKKAFLLVSKVVIPTFKIAAWSVKAITYKVLGKKVPLPKNPLGRIIYKQWFGGTIDSSDLIPFWADASKVFDKMFGWIPFSGLLKNAGITLTKAIMGRERFNKTFFALDDEKVKQERARQEEKDQEERKRKQEKEKKENNKNYNKRNQKERKWGGRYNKDQKERTTEEATEEEVVNADVKENKSLLSGLKNLFSKKSPLLKILKKKEGSGGSIFGIFGKLFSLPGLLLAGLGIGLLESSSHSSAIKSIMTFFLSANGGIRGAITGGIAGFLIGMPLGIPLYGLAAGVILGAIGANNLYNGVRSLISGFKTAIGSSSFGKSGSHKTTLQIISSSLQSALLWGLAGFVVGGPYGALVGALIGAAIEPLTWVKNKVVTWFTGMSSNSRKKTQNIVVKSLQYALLFGISGFFVAGPYGALVGALIGAAIEPLTLVTNKIVAWFKTKSFKQIESIVLTELKNTLLWGITGFFIGGPYGAAIGTLVGALIEPITWVTKKVVSWFNTSKTAKKIETTLSKTTKGVLHYAYEAWKLEGKSPEAAVIGAILGYVWHDIKSIGHDIAVKFGFAKNSEKKTVKAKAKDAQKESKKQTIHIIAHPEKVKIESKKQPVYPEVHTNIHPEEVNKQTKKAINIVTYAYNKYGIAGAVSAANLEAIKLHLEEEYKNKKGMIFNPFSDTWQNSSQGLGGSGVLTGAGGPFASASSYTSGSGIPAYMGKLAYQNIHKWTPDLNKYLFSGPGAKIPQSLAIGQMIQESGGNQNASSGPAGAHGLYQFEKPTWDWVWSDRKYFSKWNPAILTYSKGTIPTRTNPIASMIAYRAYVGYLMSKDHGNLQSVISDYSGNQYTLGKVLNNDLGYMNYQKKSTASPLKKNLNLPQQLKRKQEKDELKSNTINIVNNAPTNTNIVKQDVLKSEASKIHSNPNLSAYGFNPTGS